MLMTNQKSPTISIKTTSILSFLIVLALFVYIAIRAGRMAFTHDECNTYSIVQSSGGGGG